MLSLVCPQVDPLLAVVAHPVATEGHPLATLDADVRHQEAEVVGRLPLHADKGLGKQ